jgi:hypothetical protein
MSVLPIFLGKKVSRIMGDRLFETSLTAFKTGKASAINFAESVKEEGLIKASKEVLDKKAKGAAELINKFLEKCINAYNSVLGREIKAVKEIVQTHKESRVLKQQTDQGKKRYESSETLEKELAILHDKIHGDVAGVYRELKMIASQLEDKIMKLFEVNIRTTRPNPGEAEEAMRDFDFFMSFQNNRRLTAINFLYELLCTSGPSFEYYSSNVEKISVTDAEILDPRRIPAGPEESGRIKLVETINSIRRKINNWSGSDKNMLKMEPLGQSVFAGPDVRNLAEIPSSGKRAKPAASHSLFDEKGTPLFGKMEEGRKHAAAFAANQRHVPDLENSERLRKMKATRKRPRSRSRSRSNSSSRSSSSGSSRDNRRRKPSTVKNGRGKAQAKKAQPPSPSPSPPPVNIRSRRQLAPPLAIVPAPPLARAPPLAPAPSGRGFGSGFASGFGGPAAGGLTAREKAEKAKMQVQLEEGEEIPYSPYSPYQSPR